MIERDLAVLALAPRAVAVHDLAAVLQPAEELVAAAPAHALQFWAFTFVSLAVGCALFTSAKPTKVPIKGT